MTWWRKLASQSAKWGDAVHGRFERRRERKRLKAVDREEEGQHLDDCWDSFYLADEIYPGERHPMFFDPNPQEKP